MSKITNKSIKKMKLPEKGQRILWDTELKGFGVRLTINRKAFVVQGRVNGRDRRVKVASCDTFSAEEARKKARAILQDMANGIDPNQAKKRKTAQAIKLKEVVKDYLIDRELKDSSIRDIHKHLKGVFKPWGDQPITSISRDMVRDLFRKKTEQSPAQANQAFRILRALLNYAMETYRPGNKPIISENPVQVISGAKIWNKIKPKNRRIPLDQVGRAWVMLENMQADPAQTVAFRSMVDAVIFCLLTGCRWGESQRLLWNNVDLESGTWHIEDPKNKIPVTLPFCTQAHGLLENRGRIKGNDFVFCSNKSSTGYIGPGRFITDRLAKALNIELSSHDLRRTFRSIAADCNVELWRTKLLMNHKISNDITIAAYTEKEDLEYLRPNIQTIGDWIERQGKISTTDNVVDINTVRVVI